MPAINRLLDNGTEVQPFRRTLNLIGATISDDSDDDRTDISFNTPSLTTLTVSGLATFNGNVDIGNAATDTLTITSAIDASLLFLKEANYTVTVGTSTTAATAGGNLTVAAGAGSTTGAGGNLPLAGGAGGNDAVGGNASLTGGAAGGGNRAGGTSIVTGGAGAGTAAGGAAGAVGGAGGATGAGGAVNVTGGAGGATSGTGGAVAIDGGAGTNGNANGGAVTVRGGNAHGSGTDGVVNIGDANTSAIGIGASGITTTFSGPVSLAAGIGLSGAAGSGAITFGSMTGDMTLPTGSISWAGAGTKTMSLVGAAAFTLTGGATSVWSVSAGDLRLDAAAVLNLGTTAATSVNVGRSGQSIGFYGVAAVARASAYTQTYSTADKTHANPTAATLTDNGGGGATDNTIGAITGDQTVKDAVSELADEINKLIADVADVKQLCNSVIDDLQAYGLFQ